jgi:hypothetical protein
MRRVAEFVQDVAEGLAWATIGIGFEFLLFFGGRS